MLDLTTGFKMFNVICETSKRKERIQERLKGFEKGLYNKEELVYLLSLDLSTLQIADLFEKLGIEV